VQKSLQGPMLKSWPSPLKLRAQSAAGEGIARLSRFLSDRRVSDRTIYGEICLDVAALVQVT
jgi:hypothetical protein